MPSRVFVDTQIFGKWRDLYHSAQQPRLVFRREFGDAPRSLWRSDEQGASSLAVCDAAAAKDAAAAASVAASSAAESKGDAKGDSKSHQPAAAAARKPADGAKGSAFWKKATALGAPGRPAIESAAPAPKGDLPVHCDAFLGWLILGGDAFSLQLRLPSQRQRQPRPPQSDCHASSR